MSRTRFALTSPARHAAVELRAYLAAERAGFAGCPVAYWLAAEAAEARSDAAKRGAATRAARLAYGAGVAHHAATMHNLSVYEAGLPGPRASFRH